MSDLIIEMVKNGLVLTHTTTDYKEGACVEKEVFQFDEDSLSGLQEAIVTILDLIEPPSGKYSKERIYIHIANGYNYEGEDKDKECPHCDRPYDHEKLINYLKDWEEFKSIPKTGDKKDDTSR